MAYPKKKSNLEDLIASNQENQEKSETEEIEIEIKIPVNSEEIREENTKMIPNEAFEDSSTDDEEVESIRGRSRPRIVWTGNRGRPRKIYQPARTPDRSACTEILDELAQIAEIPITEATRGLDAEEWQLAIAYEFRSLLQNNTWELVTRPVNSNIIGSRIVLRNKYEECGKLERRKARIVAQGLAQRPGVDFGDKFTPVTRLESIRILMALAAQMNVAVEQIDILKRHIRQNRLYGSAKTNRGRT